MRSFIFYIAITVIAFAYFPGQLKAQEFVYVRGNQAAVGRFDEDGEFIQNRKIKPYQYNRVSGYTYMTFKGPQTIHQSQTSQGEGKCYEFRSGMLILGSFCNNGQDVFFVPEMDSRVKKYDVDNFKNDLYVYNLPVSHQGYWENNRNAPRRNKKPEQVKFLELSAPKGYVLVDLKTSSSYKKYIKTYKGKMEFGDFDTRGVFCPDHSIAVLPSLSFNINFRMGDDLTRDYICSQYNLVQNGMEEEKVYEFRADRLIPGVLKGNTGLFVPTEGKKIISLSDYKVGEDNRIYNLPGYFERKP